MLELRVRADKSGDPLRTEYRNAKNQTVLNPPPGSDLREVPIWPTDGVEIKGEAPEYHNFADALVSRGITEGWLEIDGLALHSTEGYERNPVVTGDAIVLKTPSGDVRYRINEAPGKYDDDNEPSGKRVSNEYACRLES